MATANNVTDAGDNIEQYMKSLREKLRELGADEGRGGKSRPEAAKRLTQAAFDGLIDEDDAKSMYGEYIRGVANVAAKNPLLARNADPDEKSATQQVSKFRQFIKLGMLPAIDGTVTLDTAERIYADLAKTDVKMYSVFDAMLNVAREQIKQPDEMLSDEQITGAVLKAEKTEKTDVDKLVAAYRAAHKLAETIPMQQTEAARDHYRDAIVEAGGDVPALTKDEKAEAEAMAFLARKGMVASLALPRPH